MFDMFTDRAKRVVVYAQDEAVQLKRNHIRPEHVLLAILREAEGAASCALKALDVDYEAALTSVIENGGQRRWRLRRHVPFHSETRTSLEQAFRETQRLQHGFLCTEHLLLGLLYKDTSTVGALLHGIGAPPGQVREQIGQVMEVIAAHKGTPCE
ncbi:Clp protease N-terminal domain-containing protein [Nocardiopsis alba]|uniref:Clp protease N-terminal domain-containing protein n=1 Tax=Nocardiopsis alba TaxID=53437 RepID=UPI0036C38415